MRTALAAALLLLVTGCGDGDKQPAPDVVPAIEGVQVIPVKASHLKKGEYPHTYPQSPPAGGPHSGVWLACGIYTSPVPNENAVHSIEHDAVWLTYQPNNAQVGVLARLEQLNPEYVLVSPYEGQDSPIIATAWGLQLRLQSAEDPRLFAFVQRYAGAGQGGEKGAGCLTGGVSPEQAREFDESQR